MNQLEVFKMDELGGGPKGAFVLALALVEGLPPSKRERVLKKLCSFPMQDHTIQCLLEEALVEHVPPDDRPNWAPMVQSPLVSEEEKLADQEMEDLFRSVEAATP